MLPLFPDPPAIEKLTEAAYWAGFREGALAALVTLLLLYLFTRTRTHA